jgi:hypothetical protein
MYMDGMPSRKAPKRCNIGWPGVLA